MMRRCYIGLGSNLGNPTQYVKSALVAFAALSNTTLRGVSRFYSSQPMGPQDQPDYVNAVACLETTLTAFELLAALFQIEKQHGRIRDASQRWGARTLDLDLLLYGNETIHTDTLTLPHIGICERAFVLLPLADLVPDLIFPNGQSLQACIERLSQCNNVGWVYPFHL